MLVEVLPFSYKPLGKATTAASYTRVHRIEHWQLADKGSAFLGPFEAPLVGFKRASQPFEKACKT